MKLFNKIFEERGEKAFKQAIAMGLKYGGFGYWKNAQGQTVYKTENDTLVPVEQDPESELAGKQKEDATGGAPGKLGLPGMMSKMTPKGENPLGAPLPGQETVEKERGWKPGPTGDTCVGPGSQETGQYPEDGFVGRTNYMKWKAGPKGDNMNTVSFETVMGEAVETPMSQKQPKRPDTQNMKDHYQKHGYLEKPNMDMNPKQKGSKVLGEGIAGSASLSPDRKSVIKQGDLYKNEIDALHRLKDNKNIPNIHNVDFDEQFYESSSGKQKAQGRMSMSLAPGSTVTKLEEDGMLDDDDKETMAKKNWELRADMHRAGVSHGDMHGDNVFYDPETQQSSFIDFGMGFDMPVTAFAEAYKGITPGELSEFMPGTTADIAFTGHSPVPNEFAKIFNKNKTTLANQMKNDGLANPKKMLQSLLGAPSNYKIAEGDENMAALTEQFGGNDKILSYIDTLYNGIGNSGKSTMDKPIKSKAPTMKERMAAAFDKNIDHDD